MAFEIKTNICFDCENACGNCSWSEIDEKGQVRFEPIPGWTAEKTKLYVGDSRASGVRYTDTYHITACPQFKPSRKK